LRKEKSFMSASLVFDEKKDISPPPALKGACMKRFLLGTVCAAWLVHAFCASPAFAGGIFRKADPAQTVTVPWDELNEKVTKIAKQMMDHPTLVARGPTETFACVPEQYYWLLDNPDRAVVAWRRLGAKCVSIERRPGGKFAYVDDTGSDVIWETVHQTPALRIWFAEGKVKASAVLPVVPVKAMIILRHSDAKMPDGMTVVKHQADMIIHTDSKVAATATKLMGQSAPKLAEQGLGQLQMFFGALSYYLERHPDRVDALFRQELVETPNPMKR
jgi:hypothetical protein